MNCTYPRLVILLRSASISFNWLIYDFIMSISRRRESEWFRTNYYYYVKSFSFIWAIRCSVKSGSPEEATVAAMSSQLSGRVYSC